MTMIPGMLNVPAVDLVWRVLLFLALAGFFTSTIYLALTLLATARHVRRARAAQAAAIATPLLPASTVGLVTCMYRGIPASDFWSSLEALGLSVEMSSGVIVADMLEGMRFALGPAMAVRRDAIDAIGGIAAVADYYSDDFELGNRIWAKNYKVVLSHHIVRNVLTSRSLVRTLGDQLRWMKSTRYSRPAGHAGTGLTYALPFGILGLVAAGALGHWPLGIGLFALASSNRTIQSIVVGWTVARDPRAVRVCWLYPL